MKKILENNNVNIQVSELGKILIQSNGYEDFYNNLYKCNIEFNEAKTYEIASSGFVDFNQHLYEDINHMNSISSGIYLERSLITYRIFIWGSKGEGFEIFKHVFIGEEISNIKTEDDIKQYIASHLQELQEGILKTYNEGVKESFEKFGMAIENRALPLQSILQFLTVPNNINDFR
ncbi:hypothetical protein [Romboutsia lituseburensis]|uniref:Uncharacterized protein n=1 Tax=Romboutsia lituseburensis DSM 797 TaxID=1121325 RepID=A0A1G9N494_9FIRM|nr:hypothetical protein [Romboutsia lituseburensis]CEH34198.1 Hypothetical protein RLITU_1609 [Romboutsia lituseburensis]SDL81352.1 hypothetical protein SAMN04515677_103471 [Romboutsia lituseburensis DSM 797]